MAAITSTLAIAAAAADFVGSVASAKALESAANEQAAIINNLKSEERIAGEERKKIIESGRERELEAIEPYTKASKNVLDLYMKGLEDTGAITKTPTYEFRKTELMKDIAQQAAAAGKGRSDIALKEYYTPALMNLTGQETEAYFQRLQPGLKLGSQFAQSQVGIESQAYKNLLLSELAKSSTINQLGLKSATIAGEKGKIKSDLYKGMGKIGKGTIEDIAYFQGMGG